MNLSTYSTEALRTESNRPFITLDLPVVEAALQIVIAAGHVLDFQKKVMFYGKQLTQEQQDKMEYYAKQVAPLAEDLSAALRSSENQTRTLSDLKDIRIAHGLIGAVTESSELAAIALSLCVDGPDKLDKVNILEEVGDGTWYNNLLVVGCDSDWDTTLDTNISKLRLRNKGSTFNVDHVSNRDVINERDLLERKFSS